MSQVFSPFTNTFSVSLCKSVQLCNLYRKSHNKKRKNSTEKQVSVKGNRVDQIHCVLAFIGVPDFILSVIRGGCRIPFISTPPPYHYKNNSSALKEPGFVTEAVSELLCDNRVEEIYLSETWRRPHARTISLPLKPDTCFVCTVICWLMDTWNVTAIIACTLHFDRSFFRSED